MLSSTILAVTEGSGFSLLVPAVPDLIWGTVAFLIVALAIYKFAWPSFIAMLDERAEKIEHGIKAAEIARVEIDAERADLADQIRDAHRDAEQIREKATANAKAIVADAQEQARFDADQILDIAHRRIAADTDAARRTLRSDVGALATDLAARIVGEALTDSELAQRVTDRFLDELEVSTISAHQEA
ncbi:F0F1 ATP synthase subunit B [Arcanobacterium buesumense]|uniref:ATP synthase subunit b n=1 Tax=Arcanobacterium buesumense TaxID=2722751 RepID=A0A6H2EKK7_9ACTO|nr:F0F1 ATP synthase subunit B [Arcanobacterium buesumense]QJC21371.1 F0F1 ATP synthase subunit B [Arcanobacterium buesumense]